MVLASGSLCLLVYFLSVLYKIVNLATTVLCPVSLSHAKKNWSDIPSGSYEHYANEFDFEADPLICPPCHAVQGTYVIETTTLYS